MNEQSPQEIIKADPAARRNALLIILVGTILGVVILQFLMPSFFEYLDTLPKGKAIRILIIALSLVSIGPLMMGFYMLRHGLKIIRTESFPVPGTRVIRDTPLLKGREARSRGILLVSLAVIVLVCAILNATVVPYKLHKALTTVEKKESE